MLLSLWVNLQVRLLISLLCVDLSIRLSLGNYLRIGWHMKLLLRLLGFFHMSSLVGGLCIWEVIYWLFLRKLSLTIKLIKKERLRFESHFSIQVVIFQLDECNNVLAAPFT